MTLRDDLDRLYGDALHLRDRAIPALRVMQRELSDHDGYPSTASGADRGGGGRSAAESTVVERAVEARVEHGRGNEGASIAVDLIHRLTGDAVTITGRLVRIVDRWSEPVERGQKVRCVVGSPEMPGYLDWADPTCDRIGTSRRAGLCDACYQRRRHWVTTRASAA